MKRICWLVIMGCSSSPVVPSGSSNSAEPNVVSGISTNDPSSVAVPGAAKPSAPVAITLSAQPSANNTFQLTLSATPDVDVTDFTVIIDGQRHALGARRKGDTFAVSHVVQLAPREEGRDVIASARTVANGRVMTKAVSVRIGAPAPQTPTTTVTLPDGTVVNEVRP